MWPGGRGGWKRAARHGLRRAFVPTANPPGKALEGMTVVAVDNLAQALDAL